MIAEVGVEYVWDQQDGRMARLAPGECDELFGDS